MVAIAPAPYGPGREGKIVNKSWLLVTLDSCRFDSLADTPEGDALARRLWPAPKSKRSPDCVERRWTTATWTGPAHYAFLSGALPHVARPKDTHRTPDLYRGGISHIAESLEIPTISFSEAFLRTLSLPMTLPMFGYRTHLLAGLPVLNRGTPIGRMFHEAVLLTSIRTQLDLALAALNESRSPAFVMLNARETHYPYATEEAPADPGDPILSGLHGAAKSLAAGEGVPMAVFEWLTPERLRALHVRQTEAARFCARLLLGAVDRLPKGTRVTVTADHGEAFGEGGWFGHGPVVDPIVLEVPWIDGFA